MKGIILAGGKATRLYPLTHAISKQLLPVYKHPMIYYPINTLIEMGITDILIIVDPTQLHLFREALKHIQCSAKISLTTQLAPKGLAEAFIIAEEWLDGDDATLILGDNIVINNHPITPIKNTIFTFKVQHPERYGVAQVDDKGNISKLVEKPQTFISNDAIIGLYVLDNKACEIAKNLKPSPRGELEIVDLILSLNQLQSIKVQKLDGFWFDAGNHDDLLDCANLVRAIETRSSKKIISFTDVSAPASNKMQN